MNQPEPDPGNPRKVTTMIFTDAEMGILDEALEEFTTSLSSVYEDIVKLHERIRAAAREK